MIYGTPAPEEPLDQGDLIERCPLLFIKDMDQNQPGPLDVAYDYNRVIMVTQTCDLAQLKVTTVNVAEVFAAQNLIDRKMLKPAEVRGPLRAGRIWGLYFLPAKADLSLEEMIVDLRRLHTVRLDVLLSLCRTGKRRARLQTPYREHLAKHLADTLSRIGLPQPYETL